MLLSTPVADAVDMSEDVERLELPMVFDSEVVTGRLDDCKVVLEVSP